MWQVYAFVAPKIIGGVNAPSPVGDLGMVQMSQALNLIDVSYEQVSPWICYFSTFVLQYMLILILFVIGVPCDNYNFSVN